MCGVLPGARLGRAVAIKVPPSEVASNEAARLRLETEARASARLIHPKIVQVFDVGVEDGVPYLVLEPVPGSFDGRLNFGGGWEAIFDLRVDGSAISFGRQSGNQKYQGTVSGGAMGGKFGQWGGDSIYPWNAAKE